ncbi:MAG TPA: hypothetical protein VNA27_14455 [Rubrobacteraceae bacterium]|nr:hypothetical protein [Rubrobacteraceae bacterium]
MIAPKKVYTSATTVLLAEFRDLVSRYPEVIFRDSRELALLLCCSEFEAEELRRWIVEDGLEVRAWA